jgi:hypothetical protein
MASTTTKKRKAALASKRSYQRNKTKVARQRILNRVARSRCVHQRTLDDPDDKYQWNDKEREMLMACLQKRRDRYVTSSNDYMRVKDRRYIDPYPPRGSPTISSEKQDDTSELPLIGKRIKAVVKTTRRGEVDKRGGTQYGTVFRNDDPATKGNYPYTIVYDDWVPIPNWKQIMNGELPRGKRREKLLGTPPEEWDGEEGGGDDDENYPIVVVGDKASYSIRDAADWFMFRKGSSLSTQREQINTLSRLMEHLNLGDDVLALMRMEPETVHKKISANPKWNSDTSALKYMTVLQVLCGDIVQVNHKLHEFEVTKTHCQRVRAKVNALIQRIDNTRQKTAKSTDVEKYALLEKTYNAQKKGTVERVLAGLLSVGIFDRKGHLTMIPRIDNYFDEVQIAKRALQIDKDKEYGNWYMPTTGRLVIREFKTDKQYNYDYTIPKGLTQDINEYIRKRGLTTWLFPNTVGNPRRDLSALAAKIFPFFGDERKGITQRYRSLVHNYQLRHGVKDEEIIGKAMGHGVNTGAIVYSDRIGEQP